MTAAATIRTKIAEGFDAALRKGGITPRSVRFERSSVAIMLGTEAEVASARALLTAAGAKEMDDHDLTESGRGYLLVVDVG